jgi:cell division protein FtsI (penicillin-binding protein 3)
MTTVKNIVRRITLFYLLTVVLSISIAGKIAYLQYFTDYKMQAKQFELIEDSITANRGSIFANDMRLLAVSFPKYEIRVDFYVLNSNFIGNGKAKRDFYYREKAKEAKKEGKTFDKGNRSAEQLRTDSINAEIFANNEIKKLAKCLSEVFNEKSANEYESFIKTCCKNASSHRYERLSKKHIDYNELQQLKKFPIFSFGKGKSGLITVEKTYRNYPYKTFAAITIGKVNSSGGAYQGIEEAFNQYLQGHKGSQIMMRIGINSWMPISSDDNILPESGCDVVSTLDIDIQETAETALCQQIQKGNDAGKRIEGGTAIVMETKSGEIRAIANMKRNADGSYDELYNYALSEASPPGSTFKLASLIALIDDGHVDLTTLVKTASRWNYEKNGKILHTFREADDHNYGEIPVKVAFAKSSNVGFAKLAVQYYEKNPQKYFDKLFAMGMLKPLNLQLPGENKIWLTLPDNQSWQPQLLPLSAIGYQITLAPIHTLTLYNAIANNGKMMKPKFVKEIRQHGQVIKTFPDEVIKDKICSNETLLKVREALQGVVDFGGTAKRIKDTRFELAGKTGTAQRVLTDTIRKRSVFSINGKYAYQASFAGYVPANDPKYTIVVVLYSPLISKDEKFYGGSYAAPVFKEIAEKLYTTGINWNKPVERNNDSLLLPTAKYTETRQVKNIASKLNLPVDCDTKNNEWVAITKTNSTLAATKIQIDENKVPSVINMGLRDATYLLEKLGLKVSASGKGKVKKQSINAGASVIKGETVFLELEI